MKKLILLTASVCCLLAAATEAETTRWRKQAARVTVVRDDWGIAHVHGQTDADAVFGMVYTQAEDDFNRVETNYLNSMGRLAEAEGEPRVYQDLRMKLFISPAAMKQQYAASPAWLKTLMNAFADGLNFYLAKHPGVKPRVIQHFEPWMALSFTEGSIGGDIERINLRQLEEFYGNASKPPHSKPLSPNRTANANHPAQTASPSLPPAPRRTTHCCSSTRTRPSSSALSCRCPATRV
jgi:acyl-homoserine-lactone acylase